MRTPYALLVLSLAACLDVSLNPLDSAAGARLDFTASAPRHRTRGATHAHVEGRRIVVRGTGETPTHCARLTAELSESGSELRLQLGAEPTHGPDAACGDAIGLAEYRAVIWNLKPGNYRLRVLAPRSRDAAVLDQSIRVP